mgnify:CR=1 FL=1
METENNPPRAFRPSRWKLQRTREYRGSGKRQATTRVESQGHPPPTSSPDIATMPADRETHPTSTQPTVLITAGPTHEPIDAVRYIANRSSGTLGLALAEAARDRGLPIRLLLGPSNARTDSLLKNEREGNSAQTERNTASQVAVARFQTAAELGVLLREHAPKAGILIMAAAVADYRPGHTHSGKLPRTGSGMTVELEPVPDLLAATVPILAPSAIAVGFALEEVMCGDDRGVSKLVC